jgi:signal transduction histidine kinase/ABC-type amino acid transport substrate-binding protein
MYTLARPLLFFFLLAIHLPVIAQSWSDVQKAGKGKLIAYYYESQPFIFRDGDRIQGIEVELLKSFQSYLRTNKNIELELEWIEGKSFGDTYARIRDDNTPGIIGVSAFSVTPEREAHVSFSLPYMSDISVLITSKDIPIVQSKEEFLKVFSKLTAVTIKSTTYEQDILRLKNEGSLPFKTQYIPSDENILRAVASQDSAFGFIDLPVYMIQFKENPSMNVKRQNLFPVKRKGYAFIMPKESDWSPAFDEYFKTSDFQLALDHAVAKYVDKELYDFIESLAIQSNDMVVLLTKEKEIQYENLVGKAEQIKREARTRNFLTMLVAVTAVSLIITVVLYRKRSEQKRKIEAQQISIENSNQQLERRNQELLSLNEEKNSLIKILAHDLRTPINHIQGLAQIFMVTNKTMEPDQQMIMERINDAAIRVNKMISTILDIDSIENKRLEYELEEVDLYRLLVKVIRGFSAQAESKSIQIDYPGESDPLIVSGNALFMMQIFENLISNALKFSRKGKPIKLWIEKMPKHYRVHIKDSGPGFTEHDRGFIFKKFQRLSAKPTDGEPSTGLGLSIVKKYTELMNGNVWLVSDTSPGAEFIVEFESFAPRTIEAT